MGGRVGLLGVMLVSLTVATPAAAAPLKPCRDDRSARCGAIEVPVHRGAPDGPKLKVRFRVLPRTDRSRPALEPIVAAEGGPGYATIDSASGYDFMLRPLRARRDLIVMDNRGTGSSGAIDCPRLQLGRGSYVHEVGRCGRTLGARADAYGTGAAADDLAAVLDRLEIPVVNMYGDSYGTYFAQAFAVRHPARVRAVVLDAAFAVTGFDPWERDQLESIRFAWRAVCERSGACAGDSLSYLGALARRLQRRPLTGKARDADGTLRRVRLDGREIAQLTGDASFYYAIYRDLVAAGRAYERGDRRPLLRLGAESVAAYEPSSDPTGYSEGAYAAVPATTIPTCGISPRASLNGAGSLPPLAPSSRPTRSRRSPSGCGSSRRSSISSHTAACAGPSRSSRIPRLRRAQRSPRCRCWCSTAISTRSLPSATPKRRPRSFPTRAWWSSATSGT